ncbi:MAG: hypothetical protein CO099_02100 [Bdellovibrio sp. CG_4_9_14_3_um_filter_39_7]|nr:MAG: hypothetical protein CO099_02100 [Bdellovibrio sp. CG_4_9_14_3_um_filter_39_7]
MSKKLGLLILFALFWSHLAVADDLRDIKNWEIVKADQDFYIKLRSEKKVMVDIQSFSQEPKIEKIDCSNKTNFCLIIYFAGEIGTQRIIKVWRAVIYNQKSGFYEGDYPYKYLDDGRDFPQPEYKYDDQKLVIRDETSGIEEEINFNFK